jgi:hypothetical protein
MEKIKIALTILSIAIVIGPLVGVALIYRENLAGLVLPPEIKNAANGQVGGVAASDLVAPSLASPPQYNPNTGALTVAFNFTNPLTNPISVEQFSADIKSKDNNLPLGNITLTQPISIGPGGTGIIDVAGNLSPELINQIKAQYQDSGNVNVIIENVNALVGGVHFHVDSLDLGQIQLPGA